jgi:uncharacterized protein YbjT (DUF2867 family)
MPHAPAAGSVLLAGATGLVGRALLQQLLADAATTAVHALVRGAAPDSPVDPRLHWQRVNYAGLPLLPRADSAYCTLGTTIKVAGSQEAFRAVDLGAVLAFARAARESGVQRLAVVSALGADARSATFYNRVKGEMEAAVAALGYPVLVFARPSLLVGDRGPLGQPPRPAERLALALALSAPLAPLIPKAWRPIDAATVARAMRVALAQARPGVRVVESGELQPLGGER